MGWGGSTRLRLMLGAGLAAAVGLLILCPPWEFGIYPLCPVHEWTGLLCPGCGGTRAAAALLRGRWEDAWRWNQMVVAGVPLVVGYVGAVLVRGRWVELPRGVWVGVAVVAAGFTVWRNVG